MALPTQEPGNAPAAPPARNVGPIGRMVASTEGLAAAIQQQAQALQAITDMLGQQLEVLANLSQQINQLHAAQQAPRQVRLEKDSSGKATGAVVRPMVN